jgi:uncharacterized protein YbbK (DUF523 family)
MKLCSACLLGIECRYDRKILPSEKVLSLASEEILIPVCPEQLGGLPTPRVQAEQIGEKVVTEDGTDLTENFIRGAKQVIKLAQIFNCKEAILTQRSPSCGCGLIYDGTFSGTVVKGDGVTAKLLKAEGIKVITDDDL